MTSPKIDSSSFTLNDFFLVYLNFIILPNSKRETFFMSMKCAESRFENNEIFLPLILVLKLTVNSKGMNILKM